MKPSDDVARVVTDAVLAVEQAANELLPKMGTGTDEQIYNRFRLSLRQSGHADKIAAAMNHVYGAILAAGMLRATKEMPQRNGRPR